MRLSLTWSDPKFADEDVRKEAKSKNSETDTFERQMAYYYLEQNNNDNEGHISEDDENSDESDESSTDDSDF